MSYKLNHKVVRRLSISNADRYAKHDSLTIEHGLAPLRKNETLPVHKTKNGTSWAGSIFQLFFSIQGPLFFILPFHFKKVGYLLGLVAAVAVGVFYVYMMQIYLWCETELRKQKNIAAETKLSIYSLVDLIFTGSNTMNRIRRYTNAYLKYEIILCWAFSLSFNELFICENIKLILHYFGYKMTNRIILVIMFPFTTLMALVPDLKVMSCLAYSSTLLNIVIVFAILFLMTVDLTPLVKVTMVGNVFELLPFVGVVLFTINCTPLIFPFKQEMKKQEQFGSFFGSLNTSMALFLALNVCFSLFGYLKYGNDTQENLMGNLPQDLATTVSNCLLTIAVIANGAVSFFVIFETVWCGELLALIGESRNRKLYEFMARITINFLITVMAIVIPTLSIFINLISCFSYPFDSIFLPAVLQSVLIWKDGNRNIQFFIVIGKNVMLLVVCFAFSLVMLISCVSELYSFYGF